MLKSLSIKNFRSLEDFQVDKLGRVNLIIGKNNSGKSSVLEALRLYAGNAQRSLLEEIAASHDEKFRGRETEQNDAEQSLPFEDFFVGRKFPVGEDAGICIGEIVVNTNLVGEVGWNADSLRIEHGFLHETEEVVTNVLGDSIETSTRTRRQRISRASADKVETGIVRQALFVGKGDRLSPIVLDSSSPRFRVPPSDTAGTLAYSVIPTQFILIDELADEWDKIVFTEHEKLVIQALRIISPDFENLTFVRNDDGNPASRKDFRRSAKVKMLGMQRPVPLNSLGDGMLRVLQLVLKVFPAQDGFLLIDEFENGLHFSVQEKVWALLFELAQKLNIQIFATTHSWDCIESFTKVAISRQDIKGVLFRVGKSVRDSDRGRVIATVFDEQALYNITQTDVEVR
jgi:predicted ATPase